MDAADALALSPRRSRAIVAAFHAAGLLVRVRPWEGLGDEPAEWRISAAGRRLARPPVLIVQAGQITGIRT